MWKNTRCVCVRAPACRNNGFYQASSNIVCAHMHVSGLGGVSVPSDKAS